MTLDELLQDIDYLDLIAGRVAAGIEIMRSQGTPLLSHDIRMVEAIIKKLEEPIWANAE